MKSQYEPVAEEDRDRPDLREAWMRNGRTAPPGQTAAAQTVWVSMGPAPLASQSGTSSDYGLVSGRATSVAIDASDPTGNTVYLGGAYGGVWRSANAASANAADVT